MATMSKLSRAVKRLRDQALHLSPWERALLVVLAAYLHQAGIRAPADRTDARALLCAAGAPTIYPERADADDLRRVHEVLIEHDLADLPLGEIALMVLGQGALGAYGTYYPTPRPVAEIMVRVTVRPGDVVYDPACGSGTLLWAAARAGASALIGHELDHRMWQIASIEARLQPERARVHLWLMDGLRAMPNLMPDVILCNPPFAVVREVMDLPDTLRGARNLAAAFLARVVSLMQPNTRAAVIVPDSMLAGQDRFGVALRREVETRGLLRDVIALPEDAFAPWASVRTGMLVLEGKSA